MNQTVVETDAKPPEDKTAIECYESFRNWVRMIRTHRDLGMAETLQRFAGPAIYAEYLRCVQELSELARSGEPVFANDLGGES